MYYVKLSKSDYDPGVVFYFDTLAAAFSFAEDLLASALPNKEGKLPIVSIWEEPDEKLTTATND